MRSKPIFNSIDELQTRIDNYFTSINAAVNEQKRSAQKTSTRQPVAVNKHSSKSAPPTITGLALFLGFTNIAELDKHTAKGKFAQILKRARLRIESEYEKKLHLPSPSGAIFALKNLGWNEKPDDKTQAGTMLKIKIIEAGPKLAGTEKEVVI